MAQTHTSTSACNERNKNNQIIIKQNTFTERKTKNHPLHSAFCVRIRNSSHKQIQNYTHPPTHTHIYIYKMLKENAHFNCLMLPRLHAIPNNKSRKSRICAQAIHHEWIPSLSTIIAKHHHHHHHRYLHRKNRGSVSLQRQQNIQACSEESNFSFLCQNHTMLNLLIVRAEKKMLLERERSAVLSIALFSQDGKYTILKSTKKKQTNRYAIYIFCCYIFTIICFPQT